MQDSLAVYRFNRAIVRQPGKSVTTGLRAVDLGDPDYEGVKSEHAAYVAALRSAGVAVEVLPALEAFPDSIFVEDPALAFPEGAILLRPPAESRAGEVETIEPILRSHFKTVLTLSGEGFADGGDILVTPGAVLIGLSARTDRPGAEALKDCLDKFGYAAEIVSTPESVLHFKTACSLIDEETILTTPTLAHTGVFDGYRHVITPEGEEAAANALRVNDVVLLGAGFPRTREALEQLGVNVVMLPTEEIGKLDAGLSCMSLRWRTL